MSWVALIFILALIVKAIEPTYGKILFVTMSTTIGMLLIFCITDIVLFRTLSRLCAVIYAIISAGVIFKIIRD